MAGPRAIRRRRYDGTRSQEASPQEASPQEAESGPSLALHRGVGGENLPAHRQTYLETEAMPVLKNARHERFIQGVVKGISPGPAYTAAGYEVTGNSAESAAARLFRNVQVKERYGELMAPAIEATQGR